MGVHGLTSFVNSISSLGAYYAFDTRDALTPTPFIVDGSAFLYHIGLHDVVEGGRYAEFIVDVQRYVAYWRAVGLEPVVVWDGPWGESKFDTVISRTQEAINKIVRFSHLSDPSHNDCRDATRLPPLAWIACVDAMREMDVVLVYAEEEADWVTADLAQKLNGFCTSNDSDYFIFPLESQGYVPLSAITYGPNLLPHLSPSESSSSKPTLKFRAYKPQELATYLHMPVAHLPVLAALIGNDLADHLKILVPSTREMRYPKQVDKKSISLLAYRLSVVPSSLSAVEALDAVLALLTTPTIASDVTPSLLHSLESYTLTTHSPLFPFHPSHSDSSSQGTIRTLYLQACLECRLGSFLPVLLKHALVVLPISVEDPAVKSVAVTAGRPIRLFLYELLRREGIITEVREWCRRAEGVVKYDVPTPRDAEIGGVSILGGMREVRLEYLLQYLSPGRLPPPPSPRSRHPLAPILIILSYLQTLSGIPPWSSQETLSALLMYTLHLSSSSLPPSLQTTTLASKKIRQRSLELETCIFWIRVAFEVLLLTSPSSDDQGLSTAYQGFSGKVFCRILSLPASHQGILESLNPGERTGVEGGMRWLGFAV